LADNTTLIVVTIAILGVIAILASAYFVPAPVSTPTTHDVILTANVVEPMKPAQKDVQLTLKVTGSSAE
jgi:ABC-type phosphate transport system auxiliary subunit